MTRWKSPAKTGFICFAHFFFCPSHILCLMYANVEELIFSSQRKDNTAYPLTFVGWMVIILFAAQTMRPSLAEYCVLTLFGCSWYGPRLYPYTHTFFIRSHGILFQQYTKHNFDLKEKYEYFQNHRTKCKFSHLAIVHSKAHRDLLTLSFHMSEKYYFSLKRQ